MPSATHDQAAAHLDAHAQSIDDLHRKLAATPGVDQARLTTVVAKYKEAFHQFRDDALGCMN
jgi:hypothetical protein